MVCVQLPARRFECSGLLAKQLDVFLRAVPGLVDFLGALLYPCGDFLMLGLDFLV